MQCTCMYIYTKYKQAHTPVQPTFCPFSCNVKFQKFVTTELVFQRKFQVELLIPELQFLDDEGAQVELWELSRIYLESLREELGSQVMKR